jgi:hypothetical protein
MAMSAMSAVAAGALTWIARGSTPRATHGVQKGAQALSMPVAGLTTTMMNLL